MSEPSSLAGRVENAAKRWRHLEAESEKVWTDLESLPEPEARQAVCGILLAIGLENCNFVNELKRLGVHASCHYDEHGAHYQVAFAPGLTLTEDEAGAYVFLRDSYLCNSHVIWAVSAATTPDWDTPRALAALRQALDEGPVVLAGLAQKHELLAPLPEQREAANMVSAGWADVHLRVFGRLKRALEGTNKQEELPAATALAWAERDPSEPLMGRSSTLSRISRLLADLGTPKQEVPVPEVHGTAEAEFEAQEEARHQLRELVEKARLSQRESDVLNLHLKGYEQRNIAEELGVAEGTIKSLWSRARKKLREAAT